MKYENIFYGRNNNQPFKSLTCATKARSVEPTWWFNAGMFIFSMILKDNLNESLSYKVLNSRLNDHHHVCMCGWREKEINSLGAPQSDES